MVISRKRAYGVGAPTLQFQNSPVIAKRAPATSDIEYDLGQFWLDATTLPAASYEYLGDGHWYPGASVNTYPITQYVVGPVGLAGYQHIQEVIDSIKTQFGAHVIFVMPGLYAQDLDFTGFTFPANVHIRSTPLHAQGSIDGVAIIGNITPPLDGRIFFENVNLIATTGSIFTSSEAGESLIWLRNCNVETTSGGFIFDLDDWTSSGEIVVEGLRESGIATANSLVNNTGGCKVSILDSIYAGTATGSSSVFSGETIIRNSVIYCPVNFGTGASLTVESSTFNAAVTISGNGTGIIDLSRFNSGASASITMSSSGAISLLNSIVSSSNNPAIAGAGAGILTLGDVTFTSNANIAGTLTTSFVTTRGIFQVPVSTNSAGASPQVVNARNGQVIFTDVIANGAYGTLTLTNSLISASSLVIAMPSCTTVNSALSIVGTVPGSGSVAFRIYNAGSASTAANILVNFWVIN